MINRALSYSEQDVLAMEVALSVLRGMGEKGNEYMQARYSLLMKLRATIGRPTPKFPPTTSIAMPAFSSPTAQLSSSSTLINMEPLYGRELDSLVAGGFRPDQDISFTFDTNDDHALWEQISSNIDISMDTVWIEDTLKKNGHNTSIG
jgi:proline utilization trans-activator